MTNVLLVTSNGTGMGHLTRQAAVALALGDRHRATLFSLSIGLPLTTGMGISGEYCPSYDRPWIATRDWHGYLRDRLVAIVEETESRVVLFDGVAPYSGIGQATTLLREVAFVWLRRGMWRPGTGTKSLRRSRFFDLVVEPGDLAGDADRGATTGVAGVRQVAPISLIEALEPISRDRARQLLELPLDREVALVTLGSGRLGDVAGPREVAVSTLLEESDLHIAVTSPAVAENQVLVSEADRVTEIKGVYPLVSYLEAFDLAVSSAGYNAVHELVPAGLPTLFVANTSTQADDQVARSRRISELGLGLHASDRDPESVATGIREFLDVSRRDAVAKAAAETRSQMTGAGETGELVTSSADGFTRRRRRPSVVIANQVQRTKDAIKSALGEERTASLKRLLGREPTPVTQKATVHLVGGPEATSDEGTLSLMVTEKVSVEDLRGQRPVEHLLPGSSPEYRERRLDMIHNYYDVTG